MRSRTRRAYTLALGLGTAALVLACAREGEPPATPAPRGAAPAEDTPAAIEIELGPPRGSLGCEPGGDDDRLDAALAEASERAGAGREVAVIVRHRHALCRSHRLPSGVALVGVAGGGFVQTSPATNLLELDRVHDVEVRGLALALADEAGSHAAGGMAKAITVFSSSSIAIRDNAIHGGKFAIFLADSDIGSLAEVPDPDAPCSLAPANRDVVIEANRIDDTESSGLVVHALERGRIAANLIRGSRRQDGIKMTCGPIREVVVAHNILADNARDGLDVAWLAVEGAGEFRDNELRANLAIGNHLQGLELKSTQSCASGGDRLAIGSGAIVDNLALNNGGYGLALQKVYAPGSCDANETKLEIRGNVLWSDGGDPHRGGLSVNDCRNLRFVDNPIWGYALDEACAAWRCSKRARDCVAADDPRAAELPLHFACDVALRGDSSAHLEFIDDRHRFAVAAGSDGVARPVPEREHPEARPP
ncbi:MAG: right-handed parallel beta-helix repeat-containing protein, partial [Myxococcales bacterium]|nr:right-handed parallel beta-helix repeat-containing protein [Myxococcales bacterium]